MFGFQHIACDPLTILLKILQNLVGDMVLTFRLGVGVMFQYITQDYATSKIMAQLLFGV